MDRLGLVSAQAPIQGVQEVKWPELKVNHMHIPRLRMLEALPWCFLVPLFLVHGYKNNFTAVPLNLMKKIISWYHENFRNWGCFLG
jgi:hypothetical protein